MAFGGMAAATRRAALATRAPATRPRLAPSLSGCLSTILLVLVLTSLPSATRLAVAQTPPLQQTPGLSTAFAPVDSAGMVVECRTAADLTQAFATDAVVEARLVADISVREADWGSVGPLPVRVARNLTMVGVGASWPLLNLNYVKGKVQLANGVVLTFRRLVTDGFRAAPMSVSPGLDLLVPLGAGEQAVALLQEGLRLGRACYPPQYRVDAARSSRPPCFPGQNTLIPALSQTGCVNDSSARPEARCWAGRGRFIDVALEAVDFDGRGSPSRLNYIVWGVNLDFGCRVITPEDCIDRYGPAGCLLFLARQIQAADGAGAPDGRGMGTGTGTAQAPPGPQSADAPAAPLSDAGTGVSQGGQVAAPLPPAEAAVVAAKEAPNLSAAVLPVVVMAGVMLLGAVGLLSYMWIRRLRGQPPQVTLVLKRSERGPVKGAPACAPKAAPPRLPRPLNPALARSSSCDLPSLAAAAKQDGPSACFRSRSLTGTETGTETASGSGAANRPDRRPHPLLELAADMTSGSLGANPPAEGAAGGQAGGLPAVSLLAERSKGRFPPEDRARGGALRPKGPNTSPPPQYPPQLPGGLVPGSSTAPPTTARGEGVPAARPISQHDNVVRLEGTQLGRGTCGRVVLGSYRGERVAVKLVWVGGLLGPPEDQGGPGGGGEGQGPESRAAGVLRQEVEVLGRCRHPNIVRLLAANLGPPRPCLVMELMETSLERVLYGRLGELLPLDKVLCLALDIARGLEFLHPTIAHRDLKPPNVLINAPDSDRPVAKLGDFGVSRLLMGSSRYTRSPEAGTPPYMAPECFDTNNYVITHKADMYSFGVLLAEMLCGQPPWPGLDILAVACQVTLHRQRPYRPQELGEGRCPRKLAVLIAGCWEADPRRRPAAAEAVKVLLLVRQQEQLRAALVRQQEQLRAALVRQQEQLRAALREQQQRQQ